MKKEGTIGTAAFLAIAAVVGVTIQSVPKQSTSGRAEPGTLLRRPPQTSKSAKSELGPGCLSIEQQLHDFLNAEGPIAPKECFGTNQALRKEVPKEITKKASKLRFVIATLPDPLHTHQAVLFDQFTAAIQDAAQDEQYDFDSSWLPWDDEAASYALLADQEKADSQKELREQQPGILLFRSAVASKKRDERNKDESKKDEGLVVFVVGEEATHGIHRDQFRNALAWVDALVPEKTKRRFAILGPTFSGSLPSLTQAFSEQRAAEALESSHHPLDIYSGSVSSNAAATDFQEGKAPTVAFHSFVQNDDTILDRFCDYMKWQKSDFEKFAILSEDETAYGSSGTKGRSKEKSETTEKGLAEDKSAEQKCTDSAVWLYYPKDISALRSAYQTKSIFDLGTGAPPPDAQRRSLPTDLADPAGKVHDSIHSYGGNQTPLVQEAFLLEIVAALRDLHAQYILLRGSNTLDQLFLANFLRRMYPSGRIVLLSSDLLFIRERGVTGLNGTMTLTNYPLFPLARDWTEHQYLPAPDRAFSSDTSEGTYIAFRVLLSSKSLNDGTVDTKRCHLADDGSKTIFVPPVVCNNYTVPDHNNPIPDQYSNPIPDYSPPYWVVPDNCSKTQAQAGGEGCNYPGPATWLTVIGVNRFWPIASLTASPQELERNKAATKSCMGTSDLNDPPKASAGSQTPDATDASDVPGRTLQMTPGMKVFFFVLIAFAFFHAWCCWRGSYTSKPNFLAHFASAGGWRHSVLVLCGSALLAFIAIVAAWGCGAFSLPAYSFADPWFALACALTVCLIAWLSIIGRIVTVYRLKVCVTETAEIEIIRLKKMVQIIRASLIFIAVLAFFGLHVLVADRLLHETDRALTYWRAMHLSSSVSPIVPLITLLVGLYLWFWFTLHGLALFGFDRPRLPLLRDLEITIKNGEQEESYDFLRMFSQQGAAKKIEKAGMPLAKKTMGITAALFVLFLFSTWIFADGVFLRGLGTKCNVLILMLWLLACISLQLAEAWRLCELWRELRGLLSFLDRVPLRRTLAAMRGISWANVWKMGGNVLEVRYKVISRQLESMNHSIASLEEFGKNSKDPSEVQTAQYCLKHLEGVRAAGFSFADWYSSAYTDPDAGDLTKFKAFQQSVAKASGALLVHLLLPAWRKETQSLILSPAADKEEAPPSTPIPAKEGHVRNAEEFVCLTYLGFIQNILGRLRTLAMTIMVLFFATTISLSAYPFDPRQVLSAILVALFIALGIAVVKVYAEMHRDATLSYVTNTKPGALDPEFWFKVLGFGLAPLVGLLTRIFPDISDFIFAWVQPSISSFK
jgi:hypothetical protein